MQGDVFATELSGIMEVAIWLCAPLLVGLCSSLGLVPNHVVLVPSNEGEGHHHMQGCHTHALKIVLRKLVILNLKIHQLFNRGLFFFLFLLLFVHVSSPKAMWLIYSSRGRV